MSRFGGNWQVARPTGVCAVSGRALEPGSICVATLCEQADDDGFERRDFSVEAWDDGVRPEGLFSFWRTTVQPPEGRRRVFVDDQVLEDLFERLAEDERPQRVAFRFVLGLLLMRKRRFRFVGRREDAGEERWLLRPPGSEPDDPPVEMVNPRLTDEDVRELTGQLGEILQGEL